MTIDSGALYILDSTVDEVFSVMLGSVCELGHARPSDDENFHAVVDFTGAITGEFWLSLKVSSARSIAESMFGVASDAMAQDAVGELCNMIAGSWKSKLDKKGSSCRLSPPTIMRGGRSTPVQFGYMLARTYRFEQGSFGVEVSLEEERG